MTRMSVQHTPQGQKATAPLSQLCQTICFCIEKGDQREKCKTPAVSHLAAISRKALCPGYADKDCYTPPSALDLHLKSIVLSALNSVLDGSQHLDSAATLGLLRTPVLSLTQEDRQDQSGGNLGEGLLPGPAHLFPSPQTPV